MIYVVCDLGFGDSGKGSIVDYLLSKVAHPQKKTLVIRYCGGYQAAHHVVHKGVRRRYCQIGAGSLQYPNVDTYIGPNFIWSPQHLDREYFRNEVYCNVTFIDSNALIATDYARFLNDLSFKTCPSIGTCGAGIGVTREYWLQYGSDAIIARDLLNRKITLNSKLELMRQRLCPAYREVVEFALPSFAAIRVPDFYKYDSIIFEGSQGVLLDENYGIGAPDHVTWSTTTMLHAEQIIKENNLDHEVRRIGVLRAYSTRHGSGPFQEDELLTQRLSPLEVDNRSDGLQGRFKFGKLQPDLIKYALEVPNCDVDEIAVTCLDQLTKEEAKESLKTISDFKPVKIESWGAEACHKKDSATLVLPSYS